MAGELVNKNDLANAKQDLATIEQVVNGRGTVVSRLGESIASLFLTIENLNKLMVAGGTIFSSESAGRAAVQNNQYYYAVNSDPNIAYTIWQRNSSSSSTKIADMPAAGLVSNALTDISVYFDDEIVYDNIAGTITFPSGTAMKAKGSPGLVTFNSITLDAPGAIPGGPISGGAAYYYLDLDSTGHIIKMEVGSGGSQPLQSGSIRKLGTLYLGNWSNSEFAFRSINQPRDFVEFLPNIVMKGQGDPREGGATVYGDRRPTSMDNAPLIEAPTALKKLGITKSFFREKGSSIVGNFIEQPLKWKNNKKPNIFVSIVVHKNGPSWDFGNFPQPLYYLGVANENGTVFNTDSEILSSIRELDSNTRVYSASFVPSYNLKAGETFARLTVGMRSSSSNVDFYFGGFWMSLSAGVRDYFAPLTALEDTFWPQWDRVVNPPAIGPIVERKSPSGLKAVVDAMNNPAHSLQVRFIGDSITWGSGASGLAPSNPRSQSLSDPRNNLTSRTWVNLLRDYMGAWGASVLRSRQDLGTGGSSDSYEMSMAPINDSTEYIYPSNKRAITPIKDERYVTQTPHGYVLDIRQSDPIIPGYNYNAEITTKMVGDNISYTYAQLSGDPNIDKAEVLVDGTKVGEFSFGGSSAFFGARSPVFTFPFGAHTIVLRRKSTAQIQLRLEAINIVKKINIWNDGLIGSNTTRWIPSGPVLPEAIKEGDEVIFIQLGTNNRAQSSSNSPKLFRAQLIEIVQWLLNRDKKVVLLASCVATVENETSTETVDRVLHMNDISSIIKSVAIELGVDFIDQYSYTLQHYLDGEDILPDGLHPNDAGHKLMFDNIKQVLLRTNQS